MCFLPRAPKRSFITPPPTRINFRTSPIHPVIPKRVCNWKSYSVGGWTKLATAFQSISHATLSIEKPGRDSSSMAIPTAEPLRGKTAMQPGSTLPGPADPIGSPDHSCSTADSRDPAWVFFRKAARTKTAGPAKIEILNRS